MKDRAAALSRLEYRNDLFFPANATRVGRQSVNADRAKIGIVETLFCRLTSMVIL